MARIVIDDIGTNRRRRRKRYPGVFGTVFEVFSMLLSTTRLFKRFGRFFKKSKNALSNDDDDEKTTKKRKSTKSSSSKSSKK